MEDIRIKKYKIFKYADKFAGKMFSDHRLIEFVTKGDNYYVIYWK